MKFRMSMFVDAFLGSGVPLAGDPITSFQIVPLLHSNLFAINPNGTLQWKFPSANAIYSSTAIGPDGTVYCGSDDDKLYALDQHGSKKWEFLTGYDVESSPAVSSNGTVYIGSGDSSLYALTASGAKKWAAAAGAFVSSSPALAANGTIYCAGLNSVSAFNSSGSNIWTALAGSGYHFFSSPAIGPDGTVYLAGGPYLFAIYGTAPPQQSSWPMFRRDPKHNARSIQRGITPPAFLPDGRAAMTLSVETGLAYRVQASTDLSTWADLAKFTNNSPTSQFIDSNAPAFANRFYRLVTP
jgi:hypothetical protein